MGSNFPVSYQSLKCILEYLEVNKRCQLVAHDLHKSLNATHKLLPKSAHNVKIGELGVTINEYQHLFRFSTIPRDETLESFEKKVLEDPSTVMKSRIVPALGGDENLVGFYILNNAAENFVQVTPLPKGSNLPKMISRLLTKYFEGEVATIETLEIGSGFDLVAVGISPEVKMAVKHLKMMDPEIDPSYIVSLLCKTCIPLKECTYKSNDPEKPIFEHDLIKNSETLNLDISQFSHLPWFDLLQILPNRHINLSDKITAMAVLTLLGEWKGNPRPLGFTFTMQANSVFEFLFLLTKWSPFAKKAELGSRTCPLFPNALTAPMDDDLELNVYGRSDPDMLVFEVMPRGSAVPIE